jgi:hypothetical protein
MATPTTRWLWEWWLMVEDAKCKELNEKLDIAAKLLDESCDLIKKLDVDTTENIRRVGHALTWIFQIQFTIYSRCPELDPRLKNQPRRRKT